MAGNIVRNEVENLQWEASNKYGSLTKTQSKSIVKKYNFDKPLFYFSISNKALPDTLYQVFPFSKREFIRQICLSYENTDAKRNFLQSVEKAAKKYPQTSSIYLSNNEAELENQLLELKQEQLISQRLLNEYYILISHTGNFEKFIPVLKWNGWGNRYQHWLGNFFQLDFGRSIHDGIPIGKKILPALKISSQLGLSAIFILFLIAVPVGIKLAKNEKNEVKLFLNFLYVIQAIPLFWLAELFLIFFASRSFLILFPSYGTGSGNSLEIKNMVLPIASLVLSAFPLIIFQTKKTFEHYLDQPFVLTAKSKGLSEKSMLWKHVLRNAITPLTTMFFTFFPSAIAGVMIVEFVFSIPGAGMLLVEAIIQQDHNLFLTLIILIGILKMLSGVFADFAYRLMDPRVTF